MYVELGGLVGWKLGRERLNGGRGGIEFAVGKAEEVSGTDMKKRKMGEGGLTSMVDLYMAKR